MLETIQLAADMFPGGEPDYDFSPPEVNVGFN
jgi:hypothetical protein